MSTRPDDGAAGEGDWEQPSTRKQRKKAAKEAAAAAPAQQQQTAASASSSSGVAADSDSFGPVTAAVGSSFPMGGAGGEEDGAAMFGDFLQAGCIGIDGKQIPLAEAAAYVPPPQPVAPAAAAASAAAPAAASSSGPAGAAGAAGGKAGGGGTGGNKAATSGPGRRPRYQFDETALPTCFLCQTRHDLGECRKKDKF
jgi:hypothetical protein